MSKPPATVIDADGLRAALPMATTVTAIQHALRDGLDPEADPARSVVPVSTGSCC